MSAIGIRIRRTTVRFTIYPCRSLSERVVTSRQLTSLALWKATADAAKECRASPSRHHPNVFTKSSLLPLRDPQSLLIVDAFTLSTLYGVGRMLGARNYVALTADQIERCLAVWKELCGDIPRPLDLSEAAYHGSRTRYDADRHVVILGANAYPGTGQSANTRLSVLACLAHEMAHMLRAEIPFRRPFAPPDVYLDEAETSIHASFLDRVSPRDREDLVEDARDRLFDWLAYPREGRNAN